uniref:(California timema) hypothetical protein n=1 Tax=Timema californicum TaxID=61474 RepID=A0A7R9P7E1_TIMCA|nr:unnamed protein product [Timema californicum]
MDPVFPAIPPSLKKLRNVLNTASKFDSRDKVVSYYCRLRAVTMAMELDSKSPEARAFLSALLHYLEKEREGLANNELFGKAAAHAHIKTLAARLFEKADQLDQSGVYNKSVVHLFLDAHVLYDVLSEVGELSEDEQQVRKYTAWKATYIHNCLKRGETPVAGQMESFDPEDEELLSQFMGGADPSTATGPTSSGFVNPDPPTPNIPPPASPPAPFTPGSAGNSFDVVQGPPIPAPRAPEPYKPQEVLPPLSSGAALTAEKIAKAQKYCKWASSALNYDDIPTAIGNLNSALKLLQTGIDDEN